MNALVCKLEGEQLISTNINKNKMSKMVVFTTVLLIFYALSVLIFLQLALQLLQLSLLHSQHLVTDSELLLVFGKSRAAV